MNLSNVQYNLLYSVYSIPNIIFPLIGGLLMDKFGCRIVFFIACTILTTGQGIFAFGVSIRSFYVALLGRTVFGMGGEIADVSTFVFIVKWFAKDNLAMAVGLKGTFSLLGSLLNDNIEPLIVEKTNLDSGLWFGFLLCVISFLACIIAIILDIRRDKILATGINNDLIVSEKFKFKDLKEFTIIFWIILIDVYTVEGSFYCFMYIASGFYVDRFEYSEAQASSIMSIVYGISVFFNPIVGYITDKIGKRVFLIILSAFLVGLFNFTCILTPSSNQPVYPIFYLILLGFGYCIFVSVYFSTISYIVEPKICGSAYGLCYCVGNTGLVINPIIIGYLQDNFDKQSGYFWPNILLIGFNCAGMVAGLVVYFIDRKKNGGKLQSLDPDLSKLSLNKIKPSESINKSFNK